MIKANYFIRTDNNVVIVHVKGAWDLAIAEKFSQEFKKVGRQLNHTPWAHLVYFDEWALSTPDVEPVINEMLVWAQVNNMTHTARVYKDHALKTYQLNRMLDAEKHKDNICHVENSSEGFAWLTKYGFHVTTAKVVA